MGVNYKLGIIITCIFLFLFALITLALDASLLHLMNKYDCTWMNSLTGYFDYSARSSFGFGLFVAIVLVIVSIVFLFLGFTANGFPLAMKVILLILIFVLWAMAMIAGGLTSQYANRLDDLESSNRNGNFWCHNSHHFATGGAVFHWLSWLCLIPIFFLVLLWSTSSKSAQAQ